MRVLIKKSRAHGTLRAPSSKSQLHRLLICAALSEGESLIKCHTVSDDILATVDCLTALGATILRTSDGFRVIGTDMRHSAPRAALNARESGSTLRFLIPIAAISGAKTLFAGSRKLMQRPLSVYEEIFRENELMLMPSGERFLWVDGPLKAGEFSLDGSVSSQFISGLLLALPLLDGDSVINIKPPFESRPYVNMTLDTMRCFGIEAYFTDEYTLNIKGNQAYKCGQFSAEGDWSAAAFLHALNYLGGDTKIEGLGDESLQADKVCIELFDALKNGAPSVDISDCPDLAPILFSLASYFNGAEFTGTARLKLKESSRAEAMAEELSKLGADIRISENSVTVKKSELHIPTACILSHNDHRVAMALAVLLTAFGGEIDCAESVNKSYPEFFEDLIKHGINIEIIN